MKIDPDSELVITWVKIVVTNTTFSRENIIINKILMFQSHLKTY